jgi:hypothetical protein
MITVRPLALAEANRIVATWHSHHKPVKGHKMSIGAYDGDACVGACIIGRPVAPALDNGMTWEVTRLCTNGHRNAASKLLGAAWRAARAMGVTRMVSYTRDDEVGTSYRAAGWTVTGHSPARAWDPHTDSRRQQQMLPDMFTPTTEPVARRRWEAPGSDAPAPLTYEVEFTAYTDACDAAESDGSDEAVELQIQTWDRLVESAGKRTALRMFHAWQSTWPAHLRYSTDPFGN